MKLLLPFGLMSSGAIILGLAALSALDPPTPFIRYATDVRTYSTLALFLGGATVLMLGIGAWFNRRGLR